MKNKGFTLVEILAAVTILGVLSIVAIVSVNKIIQKTKLNHYVTAEEQLEMAGQSYVQQNRSALPKTIGQKIKIPLKKLVEKNYIEPIKDYNENECDQERSYVQVFKYSQNDYSYLAYLDCPVYDSKTELEKIAPNIEVLLKNAESKKNAKAEINITSQEKLLSWSYIVYKNGKEVLNSGSVMIPNYDKEINKSLNIAKYTPGQIKVVVSATNIYGQTSIVTSATVEYKDVSGPICIINEVDNKNNPKEWSKDSRTITVGCDDGDGSGCTRDEYSVTFKRSTNVGEIEIEDKSGNKTICEVSVNIDTTPPECSVILNGTSGENGWYKERNVNVSLTKSDEHSGVNSFGLSTSSTASYSGNDSAVQSDVGGIIWYGYVKDNVGNISMCDSGNFKVDTQKPSCTIRLSGTTGNNGWYKSNVTVNLSATDNGLSGVSKTGLGTSSSPSLGNKVKETQGNTTGVRYYGRVKDAAGNIGDVCNSENFKVDASNPSCSISVSTSGLSLSTSDSGPSGVASSGINNGGNFASLGIGTFNGRVTDNAGNTGSCSKSVFSTTYKYVCSSGTVVGAECYRYVNASCETVDIGSCNCRDPDGSSPGFHPAFCEGGTCHCPGGLVVRDSTCDTSLSCSCSSGTLTSSNKCQIYVANATKSYYCSSGTKLSNSYCYS